MSRVPTLQFPEMLEKWYYYLNVITEYQINFMLWWYLQLFHRLSCCTSCWEDNEEESWSNYYSLPSQYVAEFCPNDEQAFQKLWVQNQQRKKVSDQSMWASKQWWPNCSDWIHEDRLWLQPKKCSRLRAPMSRDLDLYQDCGCLLAGALYGGGFCRRTRRCCEDM